jgi:hypothetical protein
VGGSVSVWRACRNQRLTRHRAGRPYVWIVPVREPCDLPLKRDLSTAGWCADRTRSASVRVVGSTRILRTGNRRHGLKPWAEALGPKDRAPEISDVSH